MHNHTQHTLMICFQHIPLCSSSWKLWSEQEKEVPALMELAFQLNRRLKKQQRAFFNELQVQIPVKYSLSVAGEEIT